MRRGQIRYTCKNDPLNAIVRSTEMLYHAIESTFIMLPENGNRSIKWSITRNEWIQARLLQMVLVLAIRSRSIQPTVLITAASTLLQSSASSFALVNIPDSVRYGGSLSFFLAFTATSITGTTHPVSAATASVLLLHGRGQRYWLDLDVASCRFIAGRLHICQ